MTRSLQRYHDTGNLHFVTFSCYQRRPYLGTPQARELFERSLETMRLRYGFWVSAYVVMPEHVHPLISEPLKENLSVCLQALKLSVSVQSEPRPFWQKRYYDFNVHSQSKLIEKRRYIHRNPVTRGLVETPDQWAWSSFAHWKFGVRGRVEIESNIQNPEMSAREVAAPETSCEPMSQKRDMGHPHSKWIEFLAE